MSKNASETDTETTLPGSQEGQAGASAGLLSENARLSFIAKVSTTLLSSLDYDTTLQQLAGLAVPRLADWCSLDLVTEDGGFERLGVAHTDPAKVELAHELWQLQPPSPSDPVGLANVVRTGRPELAAEIPDSLLESSIRDPKHLALIRSLGLKSYLIVPLSAKGRCLGAVTLVHAESGRRFREEDLLIAEEFARLAAIALENARLFKMTQAALASEKESRARAETSEQAFRTFIENLPALAWTARPDGHIDYYNRRWFEYTGTTLEQMQGWGWEALHDPTLLPKVNEQWKRTLATGEPFQMEFTLRGADGVPRWFLTRVSPLCDAAGQIVRWFGTNTDIHDIKSAQALADEVAAQSREAEALLLTMRADRDRALKRVAELEAERARR